MNALKDLMIDIAAGLLAKLPSSIHAAVQQKRQQDLRTVDEAAGRAEARERAASGEPPPGGAP